VRKSGKHTLSRPPCPPSKTTRRHTAHPSLSDDEDEEEDGDDSPPDSLRRLGAGYRVSDSTSPMSSNIERTSTAEQDLRTRINILSRLLSQVSHTDNDVADYRNEVGGLLKVLYSTRDQGFTTSSGYGAAMCPPVVATHPELEKRVKMFSFTIPRPFDGSILQVSFGPFQVRMYVKTGMFCVSDLAQLYLGVSKTSQRVEDVVFDIMAFASDAATVRVERSIGKQFIHALESD
jgi:hypothetical protein